MKTLFAAVLAAAMVAAPVSAHVAQFNAAELNQIVNEELAKVLENGTDAEKAMVAQAMESEASKNAFYAKVAAGLVGAVVAGVLIHDYLVEEGKGWVFKRNTAAEADAPVEVPADKAADASAAGQ